MKADIKWLDDPQVFRVNQLPAHSDHRFYGSIEEMKEENSAFIQSLNGKWKFYYSRNAGERPVDFFKEDFAESTLRVSQMSKKFGQKFGEIEVPCHIEMAGYDKIHYINTMYPWEGHIYRRPAHITGKDRQGEGSFSEADYNPVGSYIKRFDLEKGLSGKRIFICFEGVEQAMYIWLNGSFVGYSEDSFTPSEFDLTPYIKETGNILAVEVHKRSTAAFLEDQDFFRFFGIFRNVTLFAKPDIHVEDLWANPVLHDDYQTGKFVLDMKISSLIEPGQILVTLKDAEEQICMQKKMPVTKEIHLEEDLGRVNLWDNHRPYLYTLLIELADKEGRIVEIVPYQVGFRKIEIIDKVIMLNGKRLILNGVNRHEWSPKGGRCISRREMEVDLQIFLRNNINAVRTSHYPSQIPWYDMCDKYGIYMMAETNLESHGSWQKMGAVEPSWNVPGSNPHWKEAVIDRARTNFETFKNHTSILFWSLGNESYAGDNIQEMNAYYKNVDPGRLVHYEGVFHNREYTSVVSDVESRMYASPEQVEEYLKNHPSKPFILCEYMHDMGNSLGGMKSYMDLLDKYPMFQGGFIWDFIDQAIYVEDEITGKEVLRYGGDFDDRPSDYEFSGNGIVFADRTEKPAMQEVRYYYGLYQ